MLPQAQPDCRDAPESFTGASEVESSRIQGKETAALMPRKNLQSLFAEFVRFGGDAAGIQRRGYRREKLTYAELHPRVLFWSHALARQGFVSRARVLLWCPNSAECRPRFRRILLPF